MGSANPPATLDLGPVHEIYCDGGVEIEDAGPCRRLIFHVTREHQGERVRVPVIAVVIPNGSLDAIGRQLIAAALMAPDDPGGATVGHG